MKRQLSVVQQIHPSNSKPFGLIEVYDSIDGYRSRICSGRFASFQEAMTELELREEMIMIVAQHTAESTGE